MREPEQIARAAIDDLLRAVGWQVCGVANANIHAASGVAIREFPLHEPRLTFLTRLRAISLQAKWSRRIRKDSAELRRVIIDLIDKENWSALSADVKGHTYGGRLLKNAQGTTSGVARWRSSWQRYEYWHRLAGGWA